MRENRLINHKGVAIIYMVIALVVLILIVGIAIDGGIGMAVKAKLASAVDAAAVAAGRALSEGGSDAEREVNARLAAEKFFYANFPSFPPGYLRAEPFFNSNSDVVVEKVIDPNDNIWHGEWRITVKAKATVPTFFLRIAGNKTFTASAEAETLRRDLDMVFVIDTTDSMPSPTDVKRSAKEFIGRFNESSDRLALLHFAYGTEVDVPIETSARGFDKGDCDPYHHPSAGTVCGDIEHLNFALGGFTNFSEAFWRAKAQLNGIPISNRSSLRVIVFFTDGSPNSLSATFTHSSTSHHTGVIRTSSSASGTPYGLWEVFTQNQTSPTPWYRGSSILSYISSTLPQYFNCTPGNTDPNAYQEFPIWPHPAVGARNALPTGASATYANINRASRNLPEDMAYSAREEGIIVYTLGLGSHLHDLTGPDYEAGEIILRRMANDPSADIKYSNQPSGLYCYASFTGPDLDYCFNAIASHILRLTR